MRTVKRGVVKRELVKPGTSHNDREVRKSAKIAEALSGHIKVEKVRRSGFRYDDDDAEIPQHNWRQGPDFRSAFAGEDAGLAVIGTHRPKQMMGGDAPTAREMPPAAKSGRNGEDAGLSRLMRTSEQMVPFMASKRAKSRSKKLASDEKAAFRWT